MQEKLNIAVFVDFDNIEIGVKSTLRREFDVSLVLDALKERGDLVAKFAYANWGRQESAARQMAESAVQMVQRLPSYRGDKNGGDINLALDALEMAFTHSHVNAFAIISGDSDFVPLVNKLKEYGKVVFIVGGKAFTSTILQQNCHEFISYESVLMDNPRGSDVPAAEPPPQQQQREFRSGERGGDFKRGGDRGEFKPRERGEFRDRDRGGEFKPREQRGMGGEQKSGESRGEPRKEWKDRPAPLDLALSMPLVERALQVLERRGVQPQLGLLKSTMLQLDSSFNERSYGSSSFSDFIDKLKKADFVNVSGSGGRFIIERKGGPTKPLPQPEEALPLLRDVLEDHRLDMEEDGANVADLSQWVLEQHPNFDPQSYGFQGLIEFLNYAQDKGVVRVQNSEGGITVFLGVEFYPPALPPEPELPEPEEEDDGPQPYVEGQPTVFEPTPPPPKAVTKGVKRPRKTAVKKTTRAPRKKT